MMGALSGLTVLGASCHDSAETAGQRAARVGEAPQSLSGAPACLSIRRQGAAGAIFDAQVLNGPNGRDEKNYGASQVMNAGSSTGIERRTLLRFDLGAIPPSTLPNTRHAVDSAVLRLTQGYLTPSDTGTIHVHRITSPWSEATVTWQSFGGAFDPAISASFSGGPGSPSVDIASLVDGWALGSYANHGLLLEQAGDVITSFWSSESVDADTRPELDLCYSVVCQPGYADCNGDDIDGCERLLPPGLDCDDECLDGEIQSCYPGAPSTLGVGVCEAGTQACAAGQWGACVGAVTPGAEACDGLDNDCDGTIDEYACVVPPATVPNLNLYSHSIWDIDFDAVGNTYLTEYISGPDHLHRINPQGQRFTYTGASNYNLGFSATTPDGSVIVGAHAWCSTGGVVVQQGSALVTIIPTPSPCSCSTVAFGGYQVCGPADPEWGYDGWFYIGNIPGMNQVGRFKPDGTKEAIVTLPAYVISVATLPSGELFAAAGSNVYTVDKAAHTYAPLASLGSQITSIATAPNTGLVYAETQARVIWEIDPTAGTSVQKLSGLTDPAIITIGPDFRLYRVRAKVDAKSTIESYGL